MHSLEEQFAKAQKKVMDLTKAPSDKKLLELYSHFKQATSGDVQGKRPGVFDIKGRSKYDSWAKLKGTSSTDAMENYINLVDELIQ